MKGTVATRSPSVDGPFPATGEGGGSITRTFTWNEVMAFGKLHRYGDFVARYMVRLADGTELFVNAGEQDDADRRALRALAKRLGWPGRTTREAPVAHKWLALKGAP